MIIEISSPFGKPDGDFFYHKLTNIGIRDAAACEIIRPADALGQ